MKTFFTIIILSIFGNTLLAQGEANIWYFGFGAGLNFNVDPPGALTDGALSTDEGCASICDASGNLLFYSNGETIYNRHHQVMENGANLWGTFTSSQSVLIVPRPVSDSEYFVFTLGAEANLSGQFNFGGLAYSVVDMNLDNGNGAVTEKNIPLVDFTTEKQTAIRHANGRDTWVVTHLFDSNRFYAYLVTCEGVVEQPIISTAGKIHRENGVCCDGYATIGTMKSSPDHSRLALVWTEITDVQNGSAISERNLEVFDFDNATGIVSNPITISESNGSNQFTSYGICFSPDNTKLYQGASIQSSYSLFQYDLEAPDLLDSRVEITNESIKAFGTMEIGPDEKIYIARTNGHKFLSVIQNPNALGLDCNYEKEGVSLDGINSTWGLPNIIYNYFSNPYLNVFQEDTTACVEDELILNAEISEATNYLWSDGSIFSNNEITESGWHWVEVETEACGTARDSIFVEFENCECIVTFPNAFSPNDDGVNDFFEPIFPTCDFEIYHLEIFSRWGEVVFQTDDPFFHWDGNFLEKKNQDGVYIYSLTYKTSRDTKVRQAFGDVTLLR